MQTIKSILKECGVMNYGTTKREVMSNLIRSADEMRYQASRGGRDAEHYKQREMKFRAAYESVAKLEA